MEKAADKTSMAYSEDYRRRVIEYRQAGHTLAEVNEAFKIYPSTLQDWEARMANGSLKPRYPERRKPRKIDLEELERYMDEHPDDYLREIGAYFDCSAEAVRKALLKLKITLKKRHLTTKNAPRRRGMNTSEK